MIIGAGDVSGRKCSLHLLPFQGEFDSLTNAFHLFDGFLQFKSKQLARATPFEVHIYPHVSVGSGLSALADQLSYTPIEIHDPAKVLVLKFYQAHPCVGKKILCFYFEPNGTNDR